jgi:hypothetical protein
MYKIPLHQGLSDRHQQICLPRCVAALSDAAGWGLTTIGARRLRAALMPQYKLLDSVILG